MKLLIIAISAVGLFSLTVTAGEKPTQWTPDYPCPTLINAVLSPYSTYRRVHEALQACPNITELHMTTRYPKDFNGEDRLPFKLDGSERYISRPQILSLTDYNFDHDEWSYIRPKGDHWTGESGTWPVSSSTNPIVMWMVDMYYKARWRWECLQAFVDYLTSLPRLNYERVRMYQGHHKMWYSQRHTPAERRSMENIQRWLEVMDFSHVHTLTIAEYDRVPRGKGLYESLPHALTRLKTLKIQGEWLQYMTEFDINNDYLYQHADDRLRRNRYPEATLFPAQDFITAVHPQLESLTWTKSGPVRDEVLESVLKHHGPSLKHLEWTTTELKWSSFSVEQIRSLGRWAPGLTNLTIDLDRVDGVWPWKHLKAVAEGLPQLTNLTIYLNMYDETSNFELDNEGFRPAKPPLTKEASLDMFNILNLFKVGDKLQNVEFRQGDWEGYVGQYKKWEGQFLIEGPRMWTKCGLEMRRGVLKPTCEEGHESKVYSRRESS
ncbi:hypothetical protein FSHL1_001229 [Fusarium sambucinum]